MVLLSVFHGSTSSSLKSQHILPSVHSALPRVRKVIAHPLYRALVAPLHISRVDFYSEHISSNTKYALMKARSISSYLYFSNLQAYIMLLFSNIHRHLICFF